MLDDKSSIRCTVQIDLAKGGAPVPEGVDP
jgi:hypothetical protein